MLQSFQPRVGEPVLHQGERCHIITVLDLSRFIVQPDGKGMRPRPAKLQELGPVPKSLDHPDGDDLSDVDPDLLAVAHRRHKIIQPLLDGAPRALVEEAIREHGISRSTLFRHLNEFRKTGMVLSLLPRYCCRGGPLKPRIAKEVDEVISQTLEEFHLVKNRPTLVETAREVVARCRKLGLKPPSQGTVRNRLRALSMRLVTRARLGNKAANRLRPLRGSLPGADRPWDIVHIDHTPLDIILVDREKRLPIGRPTLTLAQDAATRMVVGFCVSYNSPDWLNTALCLAHAMLPKEKWLAQHGVEGKWPVWGTPRIIHVDNAGEFSGTTIQEASKELGFSIHHRRAGHPQDGGRIERLIGTINREFHRLPGSTFSNPRERGEYKSEQEAALTLDEVEKYLAAWIVNTYHLRPHRGLQGKYPLKVWEDGLLGADDLPGIGVPPVVHNEGYVRLRLLPFEERTVQREGVLLNRIVYWDDHLRRLMDRAAMEVDKSKRKFRVRYDPRDLSSVWIRDHHMGPSGEYVKLTYRDTGKTPVSLYEWDASKKLARKEGNKNPNADTLFANLDKLNNIVETGKKETKSARRKRERAKRGREAVALERAEAAPLDAKLSSPSVPLKPPTLPSLGGKPRISPAELAYDDADIAN